jgi:hypothetical protein
MRLNIKIERDPETLKRWNFKEEGLAFWDNHRFTVFPISRVSGLALMKMLDEWNLPPSSKPRIPTKKELKRIDKIIDDVQSGKILKVKLKPKGEPKKCG